MKLIRFLSRFTFICNLSFLACIIFRLLEVQKPVNAKAGDMIPIPIVENILITLGYTAILFNIIMNIIYLALLISKRLNVPRWLVITNFIFLVLEVYYFFLS